MIGVSKPTLSESEITELCSWINAGEKKTTVARYYHISRETLYKYLRAV